MNNTIVTKSQANIQCTGFRPLEKNTLRGFATLELPSGLVIHDCALHQKDDSRWISMPARSWTDTQGKVQYSKIVEFFDKETRDRFSAAALQAVETFIAEDGQTAQSATDPWGDPV